MSMANGTRQEGAENHVLSVLNVTKIHGVESTEGTTRGFVHVDELLKSMIGGQSVQA
ncbi:hypothetical protein RhiXN_11044 [Rhizoctonia solani]|uniref:Uncharacterized protein n=1 Tax=Rhizoctonia solani TaxID=456999 RepID=A0A8H8P9J3_9AGAM|nr:uncharacterized protein RhiXN_11044 [Rhizoctonia solani]QRW25967.1 hypothetical protein RhiXN_11044 [Rhizoctonia solani]